MDSAELAGRHSKGYSPGPFGDLFEVVAVNDLAPPETLSTLLKYDSTYGPSMPTSKRSTRIFGLNGQEIAGFFGRKHPRRIPWKAQEVDISHRVDRSLHQRR